MSVDYSSFPGLAGVYLEDSYVLGIADRSGRFVFQLDAVLTPDHSAYHSPLPSEQYCYARGALVFPDVTRVAWLRRSGSRYTDASGEQDLGNVDVLKVDDDAFVAEGDWGAVRISGAQPCFVLDGHRVYDRYKDLIHRFITGELSADDFETEYLIVFKSDQDQVAGETFDVLDQLFADVDEYVGDPAPRERVGGISADELKARARDAYVRLSSMGE